MRVSTREDVASTTKVFDESQLQLFLEVLEPGHVLGNELPELAVRLRSGQIGPDLAPLRADRHQRHSSIKRSPMSGQYHTVFSRLLTPPTPGATSPDERDAFFDPAGDKVYRHPTFYDVPEGVEHL